MPNLIGRPKEVKLVSYWPKGDYGYGHCMIRHTSHDDTAHIAGCQKDDPSACVWMVPGTDTEDRPC